MHIVYTLDEAPESLTHSIFLAGPTPRGPDTPSWRPNALRILESLGYDGVVFVPEYEDASLEYEYDAQVEWEEKYLNMADCIVFWVPRDIEGGLPAFTTNIEWGKWQASGKCVLGFPREADKCRYLADDAHRLGIPLARTLGGVLMAAVDRLGDGEERTGGERLVPLHIWRLPHFQGWYKNLKKAGNRLDNARLLWEFRAGPDRAFVFSYALHVSVWVDAEKRHKTNEFIIGRPDISSVVAYRRPPGHVRGMAPSPDTEVVLIREFRSPGRTSDGYVHELPGGSSWKLTKNPAVVMSHELKEETGLEIDDPSRFQFLGSRQVAATLSVHQAHVFAIELTEWEMKYLKHQADESLVHGVIEDTERTYVKNYRLGGLMNDPDVDWSMLGMVSRALCIK